MIIEQSLVRTIKLNPLQSVVIDDLFIRSFPLRECGLKQKLSLWLNPISPVSYEYTLNYGKEIVKEDVVKQKLAIPIVSTIMFTNGGEMGRRQVKPIVLSLKNLAEESSLFRISFCVN